MNRLLLSVSLVCAAAVAFALPKPEQFPGNLAFLRVVDVSNSSFDAKMKARGVDFGAIFETFPEEARAMWQTNVALRAVAGFKSAAIAVAADPKTGVPDGVVVYLEGDFNAPALIQALIDLPAIQEVLAPEGSEDYILRTGTSPLGLTLLASFDKADVPERVRSVFPVLANGITLTLEALAPNVLRFSSSGALPGKNRPALTPTDAFAKLLKPADGFFFRDKVVFTGTFLSDFFAFQMEQMPEAERAQMKTITESEIFKTFLSNTSYEAEFAELGDRLQYRLVFDTASPEKAEELQEAMIGYKVLLKTLVDVLGSQLLPDSPDSPAFKSLFDVIKSTIGGVKITVSDDNQVLAKASLTIDQCAALVKAAMQLAAEEDARKRNLDCGKNFSVPE